MSDQPAPDYRFDIAVSFAGEDRALVEDVVNRAKAGTDLEVFYDEDYKVESWGEDLVEYFQNIYTREARFAVIFVSEAYSRKMWTRHERRSILSRALNEHSAYALPVRLDGTDLPGLLDTVGYLDQRREGSQGIADAIKLKVGKAKASPEDDDADSEPSTWTTGVPTDETSTQALLATRPPGWEYMYYAGLLKQGFDKQEHRYLDMEMGYAPNVRTFMELQPAHEFLRTTTSRFLALADQFGAVLGQEAQTRAFGEMGEPGNPDRIKHLAGRLVAVYSAFFDVIEDIRGTAVPDELSEARDLAAKAGEKPVQDMRSFITNFAATLDDLPQRLETGEDIVLELEFVLTLEDGIMERWSTAMNAAIS